MAAISGAWLEALKGEFKKPYYKKLFETVNQEYRTRQIFPPADDVFNAFHLTPLNEVKVVILGQDPYHNVGQARACPTLWYGSCPKMTTFTSFNGVR